MTERPQGQPRVPGRRPHRHVVLLTDDQEARATALAKAQSVTVARLFVDAAFGAPQVSQRALFLELSGIRRLLSGEAASLQQIAQEADSGSYDEDAFARALASIRWRDEQLMKSYGWVK